jgi:hypothetical protein
LEASNEHADTLLGRGQTFLFEHRERLARGHAGHAVALHERVLARQAVAR